MGKETYNTHHVLWERRQYERYSEPRQLRNNHAMQVYMPIRDHNELHRDIDPLPVMSRELARFALEHLSIIPYNLQDMDKLVDVSERFGRLSRGVGRMAIEAGMFNEHFESQFKYMEGYF